MTISKKVIAQTLAQALTLVIAYLAAKQGIHLSVQASAEVSALASVVVAPVAGWLAKEEPDSDVIVGKVLAMLSSAASNPRSALQSVEDDAEKLAADAKAVESATSVEASSAPRSVAQPPQ